MSTIFRLPVRYKGQTLEFLFKVVRCGLETTYTVNVNGTEVVFERHAAGVLRAVIYEHEHRAMALPERSLIEAITKVLRELIG